MRYKTSWFISCGRCEYLAKVKALMEMEHAANSRESTCGNCEFGARKLSILEDHLEIRHNEVDSSLVAGNSEN